MADYEDGIFSNLPRGRRRPGERDEDDRRLSPRALLAMNFVPEGPLPQRPRPSGKGGPSVGQGTTHSSQALAYLARTVGGNEGGNGANIATLIDGLVTDGVWVKLDCLYVLAQQNVTDAKLNLIGTNYPLAAVGSPVFTSYVGFSGFSTSNYLNTGFDAFTAAGNYAQNSAGLGVWSVSGLGAATDVPMGDGGNSDFFINTPAGFYPRVNNNTVGPVPITITKGYFSGETNGTNVSPYQNGVFGSLLSAPSSPVDNANFVIGYIGGVGTFSTVQTLGAAHIGASLGATLNLALYNRLRTYMTAVGVP